MKITIELPDEELREAVKCALVRDAVKQIETDLWEKSWGTSRYMRMYDKAITDGIRSLLKKHIEDLSNRVVKAAATSIQNKGIKKLLTELSAEMPKEAQE